MAESVYPVGDVTVPKPPVPPIIARSMSLALVVLMEDAGASDVPLILLDPGSEALASKGEPVLPPDTAKVVMRRAAAADMVAVTVALKEAGAIAYHNSLFIAAP